MRRGQIWTTDFTLSLVLFTAAVLISYTIIGNTVEETAVEQVRLQALDASQLVGDAGFPVHWTNSTVIRAGLAADGQLSMRKAQQIGTLPENDLRQALRLTDNFAVYAINSSGDIEPVFQRCSLGDLTISGSAGERALPAVAVVGSPHPLTNLVENITVHPLASGFDAARDADVIILEGNLSNGSLTPAEVRLKIEELSRRGVTIVVAGDIGVQLPGVVINSSNATWLNVSDAWKGNLTGGERLNVSPVGELVHAPIILESTSENYRTIAVSEFDEVVYASWTHNDAEFVYFGIVTGLREDGSNLTMHLANATTRMVVVPWPDCSAANIPAEAQQVSHYDRTLPYHDSIITLRTVVWRS